MKVAKRYFPYLLLAVSLTTLALMKIARGSVNESAQRQSDLESINRLLEQYRATEDAGDMMAQGKLMAPDRVWVSQFAAGRRTDNIENMRIQQAQADRRKKAIPGLQQFSEDREKLIKFYGDGKVAVASFYRYSTRVFPPGTSAELMKEYAAGKELISLVLEKRGNDWIIVHTHVSDIGVK
jgi:hypothetical protein